jgi:hypothetical protein
VSVRKIECLEDVRAGDTATVDVIESNGQVVGRYTGPVIEGVGRGALTFAHLVLRSESGRCGAYVKFLYAERDEPPLPATPGMDAVGHATVRGVPNLFVVLTTAFPDAPPSWLTPHLRVANHKWHQPEDVTDFIPLIEGYKR